jgi:hypothetical protein
MQWVGAQKSQRHRRCGLAEGVERTEITREVAFENYSDVAIGAAEGLSAGQYEATK